MAIAVLLATGITEADSSTITVAAGAMVNVVLVAEGNMDGHSRIELLVAGTDSTNGPTVIKVLRGDNTPDRGCSIPGPIAFYAHRDATSAAPSPFGANVDEG